MAEVAQPLGQVIRALVPVGEQVLHEQVVVDATHAIRERGAAGVVRGEPRHACGMARPREVLVETHTLLHELLEDAVAIGERRGAPHLGGQRGQRVQMFGERARARHHEGPRLIGLVRRVDVGEEREVAQLLLDEHVQLGGRVRRRVQVAEQGGQHAHVGEVIQGEVSQVEVVIGIGDAVCPQLVIEAGEWRLQLAQRLFGRGIPDVRHAQAGELGQVLRRVWRLLLVAQCRHLGTHALCAHARGTRRAVLLRLLDGSQLHLGIVGALGHQLEQERLEVALVQLVAHVVDGVLVPQVVHGSVIVVEPARERRHRERDAVGDATEVALS